jgi:hypothetical protein
LLRLRASSAVVWSVAAVAALSAQQMPDRSFRPMIEDRAYAAGAGPMVCVDESHDNLHTLGASFSPFGDLVRRDGYVVRSLTTTSDSGSLAACRVLVIAGARSRVSAYDNMQRWVAGGGGLLLIADRESSFSSSELAAAFGVAFVDAPPRAGAFRLADRTLRPHAIARGRHAKEAPTSVMVFGGLAMRVPTGAEPLLVTADGAVLGAVIHVEKGRAAFFGDPALFTAQIAGPERRLVGMNSSGAEQNFHFVLNLMHWLSGVI